MTDVYHTPPVRWVPCCLQELHERSEDHCYYIAWMTWTFSFISRPILPLYFAHILTKLKTKFILIAPQIGVKLVVYDD